VAGTPKISKDTIISFKEFFFEISLHLGFWSLILDFGVVILEFAFWVVDPFLRSIDL